MREFSNLVRDVSERPGMYLVERSFAAYVSYLAGFDAASAGAALNGFREWLIRRVDGGNNLAWPGLVQRLISANPDAGQEDSELMIRATASVILEFLTYRDEWGLRTIFGEYDQWLRKQDWYDEELHGLHGRLVRRSK